MTLNTFTTNGELNFFTTGDGYRIAYRLDGPADAPVLALANSIGTTLHMWDRQIPELTKHFRVIRYDFRGHGSSDVPTGAYSFDRLGRDVIELLDALQINRVHFLGLSMGGVVAQWLSIHTPERIDRLVLANTSSYLGPSEQWDQQISNVLQTEDMSEIADMFMGNWFPPEMLEKERSIVSTFRNMVLHTNRQGFAGSFAAIRDFDMRRTGALIKSPTLVIAGQYDTVTLPSHSELISQTVPDSKLVILPVVHMSNIQLPDDFLNAVLKFLLSK